MTTYIFPGQGSQVTGMGKDLFDEYPALLEKADQILGYSLKMLCLENPNNQLGQTQYTQPALYVVNALSYYRKIEELTFPKYVAGHSLGEYNALLAASVFDFETGLKLVKKRGELMSQATDGGMAAVIGLKEDLIQDLINQNNLGSITFANYNSHNQLVISGKRTEVEQARMLCEKAGASLTVSLKVSGAFHSAFMNDSEVQFTSFLNSFQFKTPSIPVIANINANPYPVVESDIKTTLAKQITNPVRWTETIQYLINHGETDFEEIGPGNILSGLVRRIKDGQ